VSDINEDKARKDGQGAPVRFSRAFPADLSSVSDARSFAVQVLGPQSPERDVVELLVSELATNALRHAGSAFVVTVRLGPNWTRVEVSDNSRRPPRLLRSDDSHAETGRGLLLLDFFARSWGHRETLSGKSVWFETDRSQSISAELSAAVRARLESRDGTDGDLGPPKNEHQAAGTWRQRLPQTWSTGGWWAPKRLGLR
jgi:anti-sigma regulatory factor (Ser/Thr protein kinase)